MNKCVYLLWDDGERPLGRNRVVLSELWRRVPSPPKARGSQ